MLFHRYTNKRARFYGVEDVIVDENATAGTRHERFALETRNEAVLYMKGVRAVDAKRRAADAGEHHAIQQKFRFNRHIGDSSTRQHGVYAAAYEIQSLQRELLERLIFDVYKIAAFERDYFAAGEARKRVRFYVFETYICKDHRVYSAAKRVIRQLDGRIFDTYVDTVV